MKDVSRRLFVLSAAGMLMLALAREACAYIDPASGSFILQMLIAGIVGAGFAVKIFWRNIRAFFGRLFGSKKATSPPAGSDADSQATDAQDDTD